MEPPRHEGMHATESTRAQRRAERILRALQQTLNHDLPNQLVALQGLLQMVELEEQPRLSTDGQEYLRRLLTITQRTQAMVSAIKAIVKVDTDMPPAEQIELMDQFKEVVAASKQLFPKRNVSLLLGLRVSNVAAPRRALQPALLELVRTLAHLHPSGDLQIHVSARARGGTVEILVADRAMPATLEEAPPTPGSSDYRLSLALVRELADCWGGSLQIYTNAGNPIFALVWPTPDAARSGGSPTEEPSLPSRVKES